MKQTKITWARRGVAAVLAVLLLAGIILNVSVFATDNDGAAQTNVDSAEQTSRTVEQETNVTKQGDAIPTNAEQNTEPSQHTSPTFAIDEDGDNSVRIKVGKNALIFGNDFATHDKIDGLAIVAGNSIHIDSSSKYGFVAGNSVNVSGAVQNDLFTAGNLISITDAAKIGGDVFAAGNEMVVQTDLPGDLAFTGSTLKLEGVTVQGNVNLSVGKVVFDPNTKINGSLTYNDSAEIVGLSNASIETVESYHVAEEETTVARELYAKFLSIVGLFVAMIIFIAFMPRLHDEVSAAATAQGTVVRMATGAWLLILIPVLAIFALCSVVGVPIGLVALALYVIAFYLAQGFAGVWLGHLIVEKVAKGRASIYLEALTGIVIIGVLSAVPYIGGLVYFLSLLLGIGIIAYYFKPTKAKKINPDQDHKVIAAQTNKDDTAKAAKGKSGGTKTKANSKSTKNSKSQKTDNA